MVRLTVTQLNPHTNHNPNNNRNGNSNLNHTLTLTKTLNINPKHNPSLLSCSRNKFATSLC